MSSPSMTYRIGRFVSTGEIVRVETDGMVIRAVDDLIRPEATEEFLAPGFIDLQVNGFAGVDYNDPLSSTEAIARSIRAQFSTGVTKLLPTIITGSPERMLGAIRNVAKAADEIGRNQMPESQAIAGIHVEGPHISPEDGPRGAHPLENIRAPDYDEFQRWQQAADGLVKLVTVSPEWPGMSDYVRRVVATGVVVSVGHTKATNDEIQAVVDAGARMSTHLGNAAHSTLPKTQNYIWDQLANRQLSPSFILDGIHIPPHFFACCVRAKGVENCVLVTDAVAPALCAPGPYRLGQVDVELTENGSVVLRGGNRLAGSALRMDHAIGNAARFGELSLRDALLMATQNPARIARIAGRQRGVVPGEKADLVMLLWNPRDHQLIVKETILAGISVYRA